MPWSDPGFGPPFHHAAERRSLFGGDGTWPPFAPMGMTRSCAPTRSIVNDDGVNELDGFAHCCVRGSAADFFADGDGEGEGFAEGGVVGVGDGGCDAETLTLGVGSTAGSADWVPRGHQMSAPSSSTKTMMAAVTIALRFLNVSTQEAYPRGTLFRKS